MVYLHIVTFLISEIKDDPTTRWYIFKRSRLNCDTWQRNLMRWRSDAQVVINIPACGENNPILDTINGRFKLSNFWNFSFHSIFINIDNCCTEPMYKCETFEHFKNWIKDLALLRVQSRQHGWSRSISYKINIMWVTSHCKMLMIRKRTGRNSPSRPETDRPSEVQIPN